LPTASEVQPLGYVERDLPLRAAVDLNAAARIRR
jgi:hypothetical protein